MDHAPRLLRLATLPLYLGPLLAGLSGLGWSAAPVFVALIALWLVVMRPQQWPRQMSLWTRDVVQAALAQLAVNAVVVIGLLAVGRGLGGVAGLALTLPALVPVGVAFLAIPLSWLVRGPASGSASDRFEADALDQIRAINQSPGQRAAQPKDAMLAQLLTLPPDADAGLTADAIDAAMRTPAAAALLAELDAELDRLPQGHGALRHGLILWATDPARATGAALPAAQLVAFNAAGSDPQMLGLFAQRGLQLLDTAPGLWPSFPDAQTVGLALDARQTAALQASLRVLCDRLDAVTTADPQPAQNRS